MILLYHKVDLKDINHWYVSADRFDYQMSCLRSKNVVSLADYDPEDPDSVVITFDGVYENVWRYAAPILEKWGYPYELFVIGNHIGGDNAFDRGQPLERFASLDMLTDMAKRGARIQWHTASHVRMQDLNEADLAGELDIPETLRQAFGAPHFRWFAFPHDVDENNRASAAIRERFDGALSCVAGKSGDRYRLNRLTVAESTPLPRTRISVIVANYNYGAYLSEAIESVLRQTHPPDEFVVIDDASTDNSREILEGYAGQARIILNEENLGILGNFKKAVEATSGDYIAFLGADNRMRSDYVERTKAALDMHRGAAIAYTDMAIFGPLAPVLAGKVAASELPVGGIFYWAFPDPTPERLASIQKSNFIHGSSLYRRSWYEKAGGYKTSGRAEDWDLFRRMLEAGGEAIRVPHPLIEYRQHSSAQANTVRNLQYRIAALSREVAGLKGRLGGGAFAGLADADAGGQQGAQLKAALNVPLLGYARLIEVSSQPIWPDLWMPKSVRLRLRAHRRLRRFVMRAMLPPRLPDAERHFTVSVGEKTWDYSINTKGVFELVADLDIDSGAEFVFGADCDSDFCPAESGINPDPRRLAYMVETIAFED